MRASATKRATEGLLASLCLVAATAAIRVRWEMQQPVLLGVDAYYYVVQADSLATSGRLYYPTTSVLAHIAFAVLRLVLGSSEQAVAVGTGIGTLALGALGVGVVWTFTRNGPATFLASLLLTCSSLVSVVVFEFRANLFGMAAFLVLLQGLVDVQHERLKRGWTLVGLGVVLCLMSHVSASLCAAVLLGLSLVAAPRSSTRLPLLAGLSVSSAVLACVLGQDERVSSWFAHLGATPSQSNWAAFKPEVLLGLVSSIVAVACIPKHQRRGLLPLIGVVWLIALNPLVSAEGGLTSVAGRLGLWALPLLGVLAPTCSAIASRTVHPGMSTVIWTATVIGVFWTIQHGRTPVSLSSAAIEERTGLYQHASALRALVPPESVVIAPHGDEFVITHVTGLRAQSRIPDVSTSDPSMRYWIIRRGRSSGLTIPSSKTLSSQLSVVREDDLIAWLATSRPEDLRLVCRDNPHHLARDFIAVRSPALEARGCGRLTR